MFTVPSAQGAASNWSAQRLRDTPPYKDLLDAEKALAEASPRRSLAWAWELFPRPFFSEQHLDSSPGLRSLSLRTPQILYN